MPSQENLMVGPIMIPMGFDLANERQHGGVYHGNCEYLEDRWKITINPILVCYKNEYKKSTLTPGPLISPANSTWAKAYNSN